MSTPRWREVTYGSDEALPAIDERFSPMSKPPTMSDPSGAMTAARGGARLKLMIVLALLNSGAATAAWRYSRSAEHYADSATQAASRSAQTVEHMAGQLDQMAATSAAIQGNRAASETAVEAAAQYHQRAVEAQQRAQAAAADARDSAARARRALEDARRESAPRGSVTVGAPTISRGVTPPAPQ